MHLESQAFLSAGLGSKLVAIVLGLFTLGLFLLLSYCFHVHSFISAGQGSKVITEEIGQSFGLQVVILLVLLEVVEELLASFFVVSHVFLLYAGIHHVLHLEPIFLAPLDSLLPLQLLLVLALPVLPRDLLIQLPSPSFFLVAEDIIAEPLSVPLVLGPPFLFDPLLIRG